MASAAEGEEEVEGVRWVSALVPEGGAAVATGEGGMTAAMEQLVVPPLPHRRPLVAVCRAAPPLCGVVSCLLAASDAVAGDRTLSLATPPLPPTTTNRPFPPLVPLLAATAIVFLIMMATAAMNPMRRRCVRSGMVAVEKAPLRLIPRCSPTTMMRRTQRCCSTLLLSRALALPAASEGVVEAVAATAMAGATVGTEEALEPMAIPT